MRGGLQPVNLVVEDEPRNLFGADLFQDGIHLLNVLVTARIAGIHHMQQESSFPRLSQGGLERGHQLVRQLTNKAHRVGHNHCSPAGQRDAPHRRIEGREKLIRYVGIGAGQRAKQSGLARVRVADERERRYRNLSARLASRFALLFDLLEPLRQNFYTRADKTAIGLKLSLAGAPHSYAAALPLQMGPAAYEATAHMLQLRQLHFEFAFEAARALREDVENETVAIEHAAAGELFQVAFLARRQRVVDENDVGFVSFRGDAQLVGFAAAYEVTWIGALATARDGDDGPGAGRFRELREFLQIFRFDLRTKAQANEYRALTAAWALEHSNLP